MTFKSQEVLWSLFISFLALKLKNLKAGQICPARNRVNDGLSDQWIDRLINIFQLYFFSHFLIFFLFSTFSFFLSFFQLHWSSRNFSNLSLGDRWSFKTLGLVFEKWGKNRDDDTDQLLMTDLLIIDGLRDQWIDRLINIFQLYFFYFQLFSKK